MSRAGQSRIVWLDYARMIAIICVVITHASEIAYTLNAETFASLPQRLAAISIHTAGRLGVPIFFFLTGYLLLDRDYSGDRYKAFLKNNFCGLLLTTAIWTIVYNVYNALLLGISFDITKCLKNLFLVKATEGMTHMWYMPVILGMYLFIPFVASALRNTDVKDLYIPLLIAFVYLFVITDANVWLKATGYELLSSPVDVSFSGGKYGFLILLGYLVKKGTFDKVPSPLLAILGVISFVLTVYMQDYSNLHGISYGVWYDSASLVVADLAIFVLLSRMKLKSGRIANSISVASFGIYLIHYLILIPLYGYYLPGTSSVSRFIVVFAVAFLGSWFVVALTGKIEPLARILYFQRSSKKKLK